MDYGYWTIASGLVDCHQEEPSAFVVDHSGIGRELIVAGVDTDTGTVTSKLCWMSIHSLTTLQYSTIQYNTIQYITVQ